MVTNGFRCSLGFVDGSTYFRSLCHCDFREIHSGSDMHSGDDIFPYCLWFLSCSHSDDFLGRIDSDSDHLIFGIISRSLGRFATHGRLCSSFSSE